MNKQQWYKWHSYAGLPLAVFLCFIMFTGTLAVLSHELDWLTNPAIRSTATDKPLDWSAYYRAVLAQAEGNKVYQLSAPLHSGFAAQAILLDDGGQRYRLFFNPETLAYQGSGVWLNWQTVLRRLHRHLMLPLNIGLTIVSATGFLLCISLLSGLALHTHWWRGLWRLPRRHNARVFWGDMHRLAGLWSSWLLLVIALTSVWYFVEKYGLAAEYPANGTVTSLPAKQRAARVEPDIFAQVIRQSSSFRPDMQISSIFLPVKPGQPLRIDGQNDTFLVRDRANNLIFDPITGECLSQRFGSELSGHARISEAADPLHFGTWGAYWSKTVYFVFGFVLTSLCVTGTVIYAHRVFKWRRNTISPLSGVVTAGIKRMKIGSTVSILLITTGLVMTCSVLIMV
ncbi:MAG: PepSY domain-containing protein [Gammaproteobacteria bacterium]|nr:PepSY domain-containing protein [Gammaproteobacteria bacterium]